MAGPDISAEAQKPVLAGLPSAGERGFSSLQSGEDYQTVWRRHFGQGMNLRMLQSPSFSAPVMIHRERRVLELGTRFDFLPSDRQFVLRGRKRYLPLAQIAPPISIEAGNLRGGYDQNGPQGPADFMRAVAATRGWDYGQFPVPDDMSGAWVTAARDAGLLPILRATGRIFFATPEYQGWDVLMAGASRNLRKNIKRMERNIDDAGVQLHLYQGDDVAQGIAHLRACASGSWKADEDVQSVPVQVPLTERQLAFFTDLDRLPNHRLLIATMEQDGRPLAVQLWVAARQCGAGTDLMGGITYHIADSRAYAPGHALMKFMLQWAEAQGIRGIDYNATDPWLAAYATHATPFHMLMVMRDTVWGRLLHRIARRFDAGLDLSQNTPETAGR